MINQDPSIILETHSDSHTIVIKKEEKDVYFEYFNQDGFFQSLKVIYFKIGFRIFKKCVLP